MFQPAYTMLGHDWVDERGGEGTGYIRAVGTLFPRQLARVMPEMGDVVRTAFEDFAEDSFVKGSESNRIANLSVHDMSHTILCKLTRFCFFGEELGTSGYCH